MAYMPSLVTGDKGTVTVFISTKNLRSPLPDSTLKNRVKDALDQEGKVPLTDYIIVEGPDPVKIEFDVTYYIAKPDAAFVEDIQEDVKKAAYAYADWMASGIGRNVSKEAIISKLYEAGAREISVVLRDKEDVFSDSDTSFMRLAPHESARTTAQIAFVEDLENDITLTYQGVKDE